MIHNFSQWAEVKKLNEALLKGSQPNPFLYLNQKPDDLVYFGVHDIAREYKQNGELPRLGINVVAQKMGRIIDADPVKQTVKIVTQNDPYRYGYHKLETPEDRLKRKSARGGSYEISVPASKLVHINDLLGTEAMLGDRNLWLVIDSNTQSQGKLIQMIRAKEHQKQQPAMTAGAPQTVPQNQVDQIRQKLAAGRC
jgi:hypothetical protein